METTEKTKRLVSVRFSAFPTAYIFDATDLDLEAGDMVVVNTEAGQSVAKVLGDASQEEAEGLDEIKPVLRKVAQEDIKTFEQLQAKKRSASGSARSESLPGICP